MGPVKKNQCLMIFLQRNIEIDETALSSENIPLVRRPTGGRAILHCPGNDELTYSFSASTLNGSFRGGLFKNYELLSRAFYGAFRFASSTEKLIPYLGINVTASIVTPVVFGITLII